MEELTNFFGLINALHLIFGLQQGHSQINSNYDNLTCRVEFVEHKLSPAGDRWLKRVLDEKGYTYSYNREKGVYFFKHK